MNCSKKMSRVFPGNCDSLPEKVAHVEERSETNINNFKNFRECRGSLEATSFSSKGNYLKCEVIWIFISSNKMRLNFLVSTNEASHVFLIPRKLFEQGSSTFSNYIFLSGRLWNEIMDGTEMRNTLAFLLFWIFFLHSSFWESYQQQQKINIDIFNFDAKQATETFFW